MKYVAVASTSQDQILKIILKYFRDYLVSMAEPTTNKNWTLVQVNKHVKHVLNYHKQVKQVNPDVEIFIDSGGFQIIQGYIIKKRVKEFTDIYHFILKKFKNDIDNIFSLDIMNRGWSKEDLIKLNDYSIDSSINLIKQYPEIQNKQLFVIQSRTKPIFELWKELMDKHNVYQYYNKYSFGGLVGLKKETNAKFSHFIPFLFWLLTKIDLQKGLPLRHLHLLGQSSKLAIFTAIIIENLLKKEYGLDFKITMDSSELIRFAKITHKMPLILKDKDYFYARELPDLKIALNHFCQNNKDCFNKHIDNLLKGKVTNEMFIDFLSQNIFNMINLSHEIIDNRDVFDFINMDINQIKELHPIFQQGRLAQEIYNNLSLIKEFDKYFKNRDIEKIEKRCFQILHDYYN